MGNPSEQKVESARFRTLSTQVWRRGWDSNPCGIAPKLISSQIVYVEVERSWCLYAEDGRSCGSPFFKAFQAADSPQNPETLVKSRQIESSRKSTVLKDFLTRWGELGENSSQTAVTRFGIVKEKSSPKVGRTSGCTCR